MPSTLEVDAARRRGAVITLTLLMLAVLPGGVALAERDSFGWAGSDSCRSCHQDHYASWHRTFHRTMTQEATGSSVLGAFDGREVTYWGRTIRPVERDGQFYFEYLDAPGGDVASVAHITRTVGSHRYQQYLSQGSATGDNYIRLHLLWHMGEQRWVHMNGAFLYSDDQGFNDHAATWNHNCIYCHNTGPQPNIVNYEALHRRLAMGERLNFLANARYESQVEELGIACESCHGPGAEHAAQMRNPFKRYWHAFNEDAEVEGIVHPGKLPPERSAQVCGQCHAQRLPIRTNLVETWLKTGPTYRPGDDLLDHVSLISPNTPGTVTKPDIYRLRFWPDGTPRLSAYEYTGLRQTPCFTEGKATCISCHEAHGGSAEGMITEPNRAGASCLNCHQTIAADVSKHTRHPAESEASDCVSCHMPRIVYGVMAIHRSHDIEVPDPVGHAEQDRPDACSSCHLDKSAVWLASTIGEESRPAADAGTPQWLMDLLGGDPVQRAIAAEAAGQDGVALTGAARLWLVPPLLNALADGYPAVRRFSANSLRTLDEQFGTEGPQFGVLLDHYDFIGDAVTRRELGRKLWRRWHDFAAQRRDQPAWIAGAAVNPNLLSELRAQARANAKRIEIGE